MNLLKRFAVPALTGCLGFMAGLASGSNSRDGNGNAVLYWLLIAVLVLGVLGGGLFLYKKVAKNG